MAHIRRHPVDSSKWQVRYIDPAGRERSKSFRRRVDADRFLIQVEAQKQQGAWVNPDQSATRLGDWAQRWLATRSNLKPKTIASYESLLSVHILPRFGTTPLDRIERVAIEAWVAELARILSPSRTRQAHQALNALLESAVQARYLIANPAHRIPLPRQTQREQLFLTGEQVNRLAAATPERYRALVFVMAYGGLRWGEAVALRQKRIDVLRGQIRVAESLAEIGGDLHFGPTKNYHARTVTMPEFLRELLNHHIVTYANPGPDGLLFNASNGAPLRNSNFAKNVWKPAVRAAELPSELRMHDLRHTAAALLISTGAHPEAIKRQLGHSSIKVTMDVYGHLFPSDAEKLAAALDDVYRHSQTDKRRTKPTKKAIIQKTERLRTLVGQGDLFAPGERLELSTNGLTVRCSAIELPRMEIEQVSFEKRRPISRAWGRPLNGTTESHCYSVRHPPHSGFGLWSACDREFDFVT
jgi:integrase